jgi:hypothetical protein
VSEIEWTDRYHALGIPDPELAAMCDGPCEGTGWVPVYSDEADPRYAALWQEAEAKAPTGEAGGGHLVDCLDCLGTGRKLGR